MPERMETTYKRVCFEQNPNISSDLSDEEYAASDLLDMTEVNADDCAEYNALLTRIPIDSKDMYQEFPLEEYAEFMHMLTRFYIQDPLANAFIKFFNKYSNRNDYPLPSTSQARRAFIENLNLSNFSWQKEKIFEYKGIEYVFEHKTVLNSVQQLLINKSITENFIFKYKSSIEIVSIAYLKF
ncbi:17252_t:CDS:2 [Funneliformis caledonium]|uniref:17252_t:CDS:1 n=1 Tax=Funneliformis caledonium TaxID=1117310 RepID=A0A9N9CBL4_9GLOM|nr:17252_t:CDS:2 [Funneliformis caledonium]